MVLYNAHCLILDICNVNLCLLEPKCDYARWAVMRHFPSVYYLTKIDWTVIHISKGIVARVVKFGVGMHLDAI